MTRTRSSLQQPQTQAATATTVEEEPTKSDPSLTPNEVRVEEDGREREAENESDFDVFDDSELEDNDDDDYDEEGAGDDIDGDEVSSDQHSGDPQQHKHNPANSTNVGDTQPARNSSVVMGTTTAGGTKWAKSKSKGAKKWSNEEDSTLIQAVNRLGQHRWREVASIVGTRNPGKPD